MKQALPIITKGIVALPIVAVMAAFGFLFALQLFA